MLFGRYSGLEPDELLRCLVGIRDCYDVSDWPIFAFRTLTPLGWVGDVPSTSRFEQHPLAVHIPKSQPADSQHVIAGAAGQRRDGTELTVG